MALTFNMHLFTAPNVFLLFGYLQPGRARATGALQGEVQSVVRKGLRRDVQLKGAFPAAVVWVTNKPESTDWPNLKCCGCGVCSRRVAIHPPLETATSSSEAGKASVGFSFRSTSLWPPQFLSPPPPSLLSHLGTNQHCVRVQNTVRKRREPLF